MSLLLNHIITFANVQDIDEYVKRYKRAGFWVHPDSVRHAPGKRNRFIYIGTEYLELCWVEDKLDFKHLGDSVEKFYVKKPAPFGLAFESQNLNDVRQKKLKEGFDLPELWSKAPADGDESRPFWTFLNPPRKYLPGFWSFALTYLTRDWHKPRPARQGANTVFGIEGVSIISNQPKDHAYKWGKFFDMNITKQTQGHYVGQLGLHNFEWTTAHVFERLYKIKNSASVLRGFDKLALIHLLATDLKKARVLLEKAGFKVTLNEEGFLVRPDKRDGLAFLVKEGDYSVWKKAREKHGLKITN